MRISLKWLKEWIDLDRSPEEIADLLTLAGLEVEGIERKKFPFQGVVFGKVLEAAQHPDADKLRVATVSDGKETFQVVCGAPNCRKGLITAFAKIGAELTDNKGKVFKIKKGKLRGVESCGMLCSNDELGFSLERETGIAEFQNESLVGKSLEESLGDTFLEVSLTPNLGHCMSLLGIARELSSLTKAPLKFPEISITGEVASNLTVDIKDRAACLRYCTRTIEGIKNCESPEWLVEKLESVGLKSKNAVVDVTNYVMFSLGQPMHAFDASKIAGGKIIVRKASKECPLTTLDGIERTLPQDLLLICDEKKPLALAGVMGGEESAVTDETTSVVLEAAFFDPSTVRYSSKQASLRTDSSSRFEKGVDPEMPPKALDFAAMLIQQICGGKISSNLIDEKTQDFPARKLDLRLSRANKILGLQLSLGEVEELVKRLNFKVKSDGNEKLHVSVPPYRHDIQKEIDLIEEVARLYGYNNISASQPRVAISTIPHSPLYLLEKKVRTELIAAGLQEMITCDLLSPKLSKLCYEDEMHEEKAIHVLKPASIDQSILRTSLLPGHLQVLHLNRNFQCEDICAFEIGLIHFKEEERFCERSIAAITLTGKERPYHHSPKPEAVDFFTLKGVLENLFTSLGIKKTSWVKSSLDSLHPNIQTSVYSGENQIGSLGQVHPNIAAKMDLDRPIYFAELDLEVLLSLTGKEHLMEPLPLYPGSTRDLTLSVKKSQPLDEILASLQQVKTPLLKKIELLDIYESEKLGENKNVTFRFTYRHDKKTLDSQSVEKMHQKTLKNSYTDLQTDKS